MNAQTILFYVFAGAALGTAALVIMAKNAISSAIFLVACFFNLAALFVLLDAHFLAATQILVYAGAITVLILFVIMLLDITQLARMEGSRNTAAQAIGLVLVAVATLLLARQVSVTPIGFPESLPATFGTVEAAGDLLFKQYLLPFELVSLLLLAAIVAAVALAHREGERP